MADKICSYCKLPKPLDRYAVNRRAASGLCSKCKDCQKAYNEANKQSKADTGRAYRAKMGEELKLKKKAWVEANRDWKRENNRKWAKENPEKAKLSLQEWKARNPGRANEFAKKWALSNPERHREQGKLYRARNKHKVNQRTAHYRARKIEATPSWADKSKMEEFYATAEALGMWTGEWHHVDHIVPLRGKTVRGLHVESNLQILTQFENISKNARWWPDMPEDVRG